MGKVLGKYWESIGQVPENNRERRGRYPKSTSTMEIMEKVPEKYWEMTGDVLKKYGKEAGN